MKQSILLLASIIITLSFTSCQQGLYEKKLTKKIEGHWTYEKAKYEANPFCRKDQLDKFAKENIYYKGVYSLESSTYLNINNPTGTPVSTMYLVQLSLTDTTDNSLHQRLWSSLSLTNKKLRYITQRNDSSFNLVMNRQNN